MSPSPTRAEVEALIVDSKRVALEMQRTVNALRTEYADQPHAGVLIDGNEQVAGTATRAAIALRALLDEREKAEADLARMRPAAEAVERLEKWLGEDVDRSASIGACAVGLFAPDGGCVAVGHASVPAPGDLPAAILAAIEKAEAGK